MDETRKLDLRPFVVVLAVAFVAATIWAAVALAAGGSSSPSSSNSVNDSPGQFIQAQDDSEAPPADDCPDQGGGSGDDAGSDGSGSSDL
jgi:hypothetical protein